MKRVYCPETSPFKHANWQEVGVTIQPALHHITPAPLHNILATYEIDLKRETDEQKRVSKLTRRFISRRQL